MYLKKALYKNVGPLDKLQIDFTFDLQGNPKPTVFVGENGSGKSTVLSNIVDAFYEMAGTAFVDACQFVDIGSQQYYKTISHDQIRFGNKYMLTFLSFEDEKQIDYICKSGAVSTEEVKRYISIADIELPDKMENNFKNVKIEKDLAERIWNSNVLCYFGPDRYERPSWMGEKYYNTEDYMHASVATRFRGHLDKPIEIKNVTSVNLQWLLDIIVDSRTDVASVDNDYVMEHTNPKNLRLLCQARHNIEKIMSAILGIDVYFALNLRNSGRSRFRILRKDNNAMVCPTLDSLSTGQSALFNMFSTIVRYADLNDINKSINLEDIQGIVIIDEVELHLHIKLQGEVLPRLIRLFPKVQFIITSHAPLFLLGMKDTFGEENFDIIELPSGKHINTEDFSEFLCAYDYLKETEEYKKRLLIVEEALKSKRKPIVITEGSTDWKHLKAAYNHLKADERYSDFFEGFEFEFFEYEPESESEKSVNATHVLNMGNKVLCSLCENMAKIPQPVKYIFVADCDDKSTNDKLRKEGEDYKDWGNNVYSMTLPIPESRKDTPAISIEHYYSDEEIKTEWESPETGIKRRLYMGYEFDSRGIASEIDRFCEKRCVCGEGKISIIEGSSGEKVTSINNSNDINYALPKSKFAELILNGVEPFDKVSFDNFIGFFEVLKKIIQTP